jgi:hypothetical protein
MHFITVFRIHEVHKIALETRLCASDSLEGRKACSSEGVWRCYVVGQRFGASQPDLEARALCDTLYHRASEI